MDGGASVLQDRENPAKIGARNSSFASLDLGVGVRLQERFLQPDAQARSRGRNTRITLGNFRRVFSCSGWVSYKPHRKRDELYWEVVFLLYASLLYL